MIKRSIDIIISLVAVLLLAPIWLIAAILIKVENPGPIFFKQQRVGKDEVLFTVYKFRSMTINNIPPLTLGAVKHNHALVTHLGHWMRRTKFDETPQFLDVLRGKMSLVGPRPCLPERIPTMSFAERRRFSVLPGLTGWAEVNGNVELSWEEQLLLDLWYVDHHSLWLDTRILFSTWKVVIMGSQKNELAVQKAQNKP